jgi:polar amino acid transport system substrate-binding protein
VRLGIINAYSYGTELDGYIAQQDPAKQQVQAVSGDHALSINVRKLLAGRIEALAETSWVMQAYLADNGLNDKINAAGCRAQDSPIYLAFSPELKSSARYVQIFEAGLSEYQKNGKLQALLARYGVQAEAEIAPQ